MRFGVRFVPLAIALARVSVAKPAHFREFTEEGQRAAETEMARIRERDRKFREEYRRSGQKEEDLQRFGPLHGNRDPEK